MKTTKAPSGPMASRQFLTAILAIILCLAGTACGQRGPLFLPPQEPAAGSTPAAEATPDDQLAPEPAEETIDETKEPAPSAGKDADEKAS